MGTPGPTPAIQPSDVLEVFETQAAPVEPLTATEVAESLDCTRRTAHKKLDALSEDGALESKKPGARSRVWWLPPDSGATGDDGISLQESQFEELADQVSEYAIFVLDERGRVQTWNAGAARIKGYEAGEIIGEHFSRFYTPSAKEANVPSRNLRAATELGSIRDEGWRVRQDGTRFWANITLSTLMDDDQIVGYVKVTKDMTDRHEHELELRREKERFESLVSEVQDYAIFMLDAEGYVQTWNAGAARIKGYEAGEIIGEHFSRFYTESDRTAGVPETNLEAAEADGRTEDEGWRVRQDGTRFWADVVITRLTDDQGETRGFAKVTRDMTEHREYQEQLEHQRDELDELDRINGVIREVDKALVTADTREGAETAVCERLVDSELYTAAWIGERDPSGDFRTRAATGVDGDTLDSSHEGMEGVFAAHRIGAAALDGEHTVDAVRDPDCDGFDHWRSDVFDEPPEAAVAIPFVQADVEFGVLVLYTTTPDIFDDRKRDVLAELGDTITDTLDAIRRKERERHLTALHRTTRHLVHTESPAELAEVVVDTVTDVLGLHDAHVYRFQTEDNTLQPLASMTRDGSEAVQLPVLDAGADSPVWACFVEGTTMAPDDESEPAARIGGLGDRQELMVPLGDHGVLLVGAGVDDAIDADDRHLVELVAATAEAAFDRLESEANLRERDAILQEQNQRLQRLNQINTVIREIDQGLVQATTYEEIQRVVCDRLTTTDRFRFAWLGELPDDRSAIRPAAMAGSSADYLDDVSLESDADEPAVVAGRTDAVQVVENVADDLRAAPWRSEAFSREFQSAIAVPLTFGDVTYGVLAVYGDRPGTFGDIEESVFDELGTTIGNALHAVETRQALLSDHTVEVEFRLSAPEETVLTAVADRTDATVTHQGTIPSSEEMVRLFFTAEGTNPDAILAVADDLSAVTDATLVGEGPDGPLVEFELTGDSLAGRLGRRNVSLVEFTATPDRGTIAVDVPANTDVGGFIDWFVEAYPSATFVSRHEHSRSVDSDETLRADLTDRLTERQYEVLKTAYLGGFFDAPRQSTGGDIADLLDVSQPTVTEHLRAAQRRVLERIFEP